MDLGTREPYRAWTALTVRSVDLDPNGHVNNGAIGAYIEDGQVRLRTTFAGGENGGLLAGFAIAKITIEFKAPLGSPGTVDVGSAIACIGRSSYTLAQAVFSAQLCIATAEVVTVRIDTATGRSIPIKDSVRRNLQALMLGEHS